MIHLDFIALSLQRLEASVIQIFSSLLIYTDNATCSIMSDLQSHSHFHQVITGSLWAAWWEILSSVSTLEPLVNVCGLHSLLKLPKLQTLMVPVVPGPHGVFFASKPPMLHAEVKLCWMSPAWVSAFPGVPPA